MRIRGDIGWWYWLMTLPMLMVGLSGWSWGFAAAMVFCVIQAIHFAWRDSSSGRSASYGKRVGLGRLGARWVQSKRTGLGWFGAGRVRIVAWGGRVKYGFTAFSVQVRAAYLILLILGQWTPFHWILWVQLVGTSVRVLAGYCLLARTLSLLPWNRFEPWSMALLRRTYVSLNGPSCNSRREEGGMSDGHPGQLLSYRPGA